MQGLTVTGMQIFSVFGVTAIAAVVFPYSKKAKGIWESSPYRTWKFLGIPVVSVAASSTSSTWASCLLLLRHARRRASFTTVRPSSLRGSLGARHPLVLLLEAAQQGGGRGCLHDLRRAAAGVIDSVDPAVSWAAALTRGAPPLQAGSTVRE